MTTRLERLLLLLDTGSTPLIRETAAVQLGGVVRREWEGGERERLAEGKGRGGGEWVGRGKEKGNEGKGEGDGKQKEGVDMDVDEDGKGEGENERKPDLTAGTAVDPTPTNQNDPFILNTTPDPLSVPNPYSQSLNLISRILPYLSSKSSETRQAAGRGLEEIWEGVGVWSPDYERDGQSVNVKSEGVDNGGGLRKRVGEKIDVKGLLDSVPRRDSHVGGQQQQGSSSRQAGKPTATADAGRSVTPSTATGTAGASANTNTAVGSAPAKAGKAALSVGAGKKRTMDWMATSTSKFNLLGGANAAAGSSTGPVVKGKGKKGKKARDVLQDELEGLPGGSGIGKGKKKDLLRKLDISEEVLGEIGEGLGEDDGEDEMDMEEVEVPVPSASAAGKKKQALPFTGMIGEDDLSDLSMDDEPFDVKGKGKKKAQAEIVDVDEWTPNTQGRKRPKIRNGSDASGTRPGLSRADSISARSTPEPGIGMPPAPRKPGRPKGSGRKNSGLLAPPTGGSASGSVSPLGTPPLPGVGGSVASTLPTGAAPGKPLTEADVLVGLVPKQKFRLKLKIKNGMSLEDAMQENIRMQNDGLGVGGGLASPAAVEGNDPMEVDGTAVMGTGLASANGQEEAVQVKDEQDGAGIGSGFKRKADEAGLADEDGERKKGVRVKDEPVDGESTAAVEQENGGDAPIGDTEPAKKTEAWMELLPTSPDEWVWQPLLKKLVYLLETDSWEARHGSSLAIRDLIRIQGIGCGMLAGLPEEENSIRREEALLDTARHLIKVLIFDRFGDFVGDTVVAPVREAAAQALASVTKWLGKSSVDLVLQAVIDMIVQGWNGKGTSNGKSAHRSRGHVWEVRHAGMLGLRYIVAVRADSVRVKGEADQPSVTIQDILAATMIGLSDDDDDVRSVSALALMPISAILANILSTKELASLLDTLWDCFDINGDDLGSSTGAVMDLLCKVLTFPKIADVYADDISEQRSLALLIPRLYPFFRHTIAPVRRAVVRTVRLFLDNPDLPKGWMDASILHLLLHNLVLEERPDVREETNRAWVSALAVTRTRPDFLETAILPNVSGWCNLVLMPIANPLHQDFFAQVGQRRSAMDYDVDKNIMSADLALVSPTSILRNRIEAIVALAEITRHDLYAATHQDLIVAYLPSTSAHQISLASILAEEWTRIRDEELPDQREHPITDNIAHRSGDIASKLWDLLDSGINIQLFEMQKSLDSLRQETTILAHHLKSFGKGKNDSVIGDYMQASFEDVEQFIKIHLEEVLGESVTGKRKAAQAVIRDRAAALSLAMDRYRGEHGALERQIKASAAAAFVGMRTRPVKMNPLLKSIMEAVKAESNAILQARAAKSAARVIKHGLDATAGIPPNVSFKLVSNLVGYICEDETFVPSFYDVKSAQGILTLHPEPVTTVADSEGETTVDPEVAAKQLTRQGARMTLAAVIDLLGGDLFARLPMFWEAIRSPILSRDVGAAEPVDEETNRQIIDALTIIQVITPLVPETLHPDISHLLPGIAGCTRSSFAIIRYTAGKALAVICQTMLESGIRILLDEVVPLLGDSRNVAHRQGAIEAIWSVVDALQFSILPYVLFLVVPVLGRMSDPDEDVRLLATQTFAVLVKLVPLEAGIPEPAGVSKELLAKRESERDFLAQLLDNKKVQSYRLPIPIKADLRPYQQDGINWLAFLAKYQLHGCLCDDMGLGKSLQSICIIASKHHERQLRHSETRSPDTAHLPSLIVCPPTLIGHWFHEITKFTDNLRPFKYYGSTTERQGLRREIPKYDVIITSYDNIRSDIEHLKKITFLYCILDEGHTIKNAKSKLSLAVRSLQAVHRVILSGTPIQNNVIELWSLFEFLMPGFLGTEKEFNERFAKPILANKDARSTAKQKEGAALALEALHKQVLPFVLRRMKEDVLQDLPPKIIQDYYCDLGKVQQMLYEDFQASSASKQAIKSVADDAGESENGNAAAPQHIFQTLQYLRKLCNHPMLALDQDIERYKQVVHRAWYNDGQGVPRDPFDVGHSPKLLALQQILLDCGIGTAKQEAGEADLVGGDSQHRVLIFCQTRQMLDIIQDHLFAKHMPTVTWMRLDGGVEALKRHDIVQTFNADPSIDVLLLTTSVGGLGLTLTGADTVIFMDHDWNPSKDLQAMDRAHRLGQKKVVNVYRLITRGTLEEKIMSLQRFKINIANTVVSQQNSGLDTMNTDQVLDLFSAPSDKPATKPVKDGPSSRNDILAGLDDLPPEEEYNDLTLDAFMSKF